MPEKPKKAKAKQKLNKMGQPESFGVEKDTPKLSPVDRVLPNMPKSSVKRPKVWDIDDILILKKK
jgi:hypothetical protein